MRYPTAKSTAKKATAKETTKKAARPDFPFMRVVVLFSLASGAILSVMAQAAAQCEVPLERISFKGSLDALRQFYQAMSQARSKAKRSELWDKLLDTLAKDLVPERPGRREPRAVKRVKNKYPRLSVSRKRFKDRPKRNVRRTISRRRKLGLK